jgi:hypothetical protein
MGLKYPRTKEKKKSCLGEPRRHPQVGEEKKKSCLGEPRRHPQVGKRIGEPCRRPQVGEPCRHPEEKGTNEEYPKGKVLDLMSLDKMKLIGGETLEVNAFDENQKQKIRFTVDSGAAEAVCSKTDAKDFLDYLWRKREHDEVYHAEWGDSRE